MAHKKKCFVGSPFGTLDELLDWLEAGFWVFDGHKPQHPQWILNRPLNSVRRLGQQKGTIRACLNENGEPYSTAIISEATYKETDETGYLYADEGF